MVEQISMLRDISMKVIWYLEVTGGYFISMLSATLRLLFMPLLFAIVGQTNSRSTVNGHPIVLPA